MKTTLNQEELEELTRIVDGKKTEDIILITWGAAIGYLMASKYFSSK